MNGCELSMKLRELANYAYDCFDEDENLFGVLLCEGTETSVDCKLYREVYKGLLVIPVGGWSNVKRLVSPLRRRLPRYRVYGMIDRDSTSKKEVGRLEENGIYCTKLPFIENIISCPEMVRIFCNELKLEYEEIVKAIEGNLMNVLVQSIKDALPINVPIGEDEEINSVTIRMRRNNGTYIEKTVETSNIMYAYRDKAVANETADALDILGRRRYYEFFIECLGNPKLKRKIVKCAASYLPQILIETEEI